MPYNLFIAAGKEVTGDLWVYVTYAPKASPALKTSTPFAIE